MFAASALSIAVIGQEGTFTKAAMQADILDVYKRQHVHWDLQHRLQSLPVLDAEQT